LAQGNSDPQQHQWSQATELGDFVQEAAKDSKFVVAIQENGKPPHITPVRVPTFQQRTRFLRNRLLEVTKEMQSLLDIKTECDVSTHMAFERTELKHCASRKWRSLVLEEQLSQALLAS
jgi:calcium uniporter protein, mitochondrial